MKTVKSNLSLIAIGSVVVTFIVLIAYNIVVHGIHN